MELEHFWGDFKIFNSQKKQEIPHLETETHKRKHRNIPLFRVFQVLLPDRFLGCNPFPIEAKQDGLIVSWPHNSRCTPASRENS